MSEENEGVGVTTTQEQLQSPIQTVIPAPVSQPGETKYVNSLMASGARVVQSGNWAEAQERSSLPRSSRKIHKRCNVVGADAFACMTSSYGKHFTAYCRKRKQAFQQRVPAAVWKLVYKDYSDDGKAKCEIAGVQFDKDMAQERTLQNALRSALDDVQTGVSDAPGQLCALKNEELMQKLKKSDTYNKKKMGGFRESLISESTKKSDDAGSKSVIDLVSKEKTQVEEMISLANQSKKKLLKDRVTAISSMVTVVEEK
ncbi:hypothetical protein BWQ96_07438 [Gracilariopsis chorda]|uniref:Uncharacterized protein n=1 Tax=Gracilariopsis chorda TaxID=448386 RepID=A0A2V3IL83_9FLOR|nr:hypothetical protein BWQ96_07438 [Gracilariopsis chorda]|eukprot:PXF42844.1 hypothetical protein BWQ96_07438 [Gracilariopsis chorda]